MWCWHGPEQKLAVCSWFLTSPKRDSWHSIHKHPRWDESYGNSNPFMPTWRTEKHERNLPQNQCQALRMVLQGVFGHNSQ